MVVAVGDAALRIALTHLAGECGLRPVRHAPAADVVIADPALPVPPPVDVLVVGPSPLAGALALGAVLLGEARALLSTEEPDALPRVLQVLAGEMAVLPRRVVGSSREVTALGLSPRQHALLGILARGYAKDAEMAGRLGVSPATLKRDLRLVTERLGAGNRHELADRARALGYHRPLRPAELRLLTPVLASSG